MGKNGDLPKIVRKQRYCLGHRLSNQEVNCGVVWEVCAVIETRTHRPEIQNMSKLLVQFHFKVY